MIKKYNFIIIICLFLMVSSVNLFSQSTPDYATKQVAYNDGSKFRLNDVVFEFGTYYNRSLFSNFPHGLTLMGRLGVILSGYHRLGLGLFHTSYYPSVLFVSGNVREIRLAPFYGFRLNTDFFSFTQYLHIGPAFMLVDTEVTKASEIVINSDKNTYYLFIHPELDFEFQLTHFFALSISAGYVFNVVHFSGEKVNNSHLTAGMLWKWSFL